MGAKVSGAGSSIIVVRGNRRLKGARHRVIPDRIETGTFMLAAAATAGSVRLLGVDPAHVHALAVKMRAAGAKVREGRGSIAVSMKGRPRPVPSPLRPIPASPPTSRRPGWPGCPWPGQQPGQGDRLREPIHARGGVGPHGGAHRGLRRHGPGPGRARALRRAHHGSDLRAGAALLVAALAAAGRTTVARVYHIDRGYERIEAKLRSVGARIRRVRTRRA